MSNTAFQITAEDVSNVLSSNSLDVANSDGKSFDEMATELLPLLNLDEIEGVALFGDTLEEQTDYAHDEITHQLRNLGVLEQPCERSVNIGKNPPLRLCFVLNAWEKISNFVGMDWRST